MIIKKIIIIFILVAALALTGLFMLAPKMVDKSLNAVSAHEPFTISDKAKALHQSLTIGDWHSDSLLWNRDLGNATTMGMSTFLAFKPVMSAYKCLPR